MLSVLASHRWCTLSAAAFLIGLPASLAALALVSTPAQALSPLPPKNDPQKYAVGTWCSDSEDAPITALTVSADGTYESVEHTPLAGKWQTGTYSIVLTTGRSSDTDKLELKAAIAASGDVLRYTTEPGGRDYQLRRCSTDTNSLAGDWVLHYDPADVPERWVWPKLATLQLGAAVPVHANQLVIQTGPAAGLTLSNVHRRGDYLLAQTPLLTPREGSNSVPMRSTVILAPAKAALLAVPTLLGDKLDQILLYSQTTRQIAVLNQVVMEGVGQLTLSVVQAPAPDGKETATAKEQVTLARYPGGRGGLLLESVSAANQLLAERQFAPLPVSAAAAPMAKLVKGRLQFTMGGKQWSAPAPEIPAMEGPTAKLKKTAAKCLYWQIDRAAPLPGADDAAAVLSLAWKWSSTGKGPCVDKEFHDELAPEPTRMVLFARSKP